MKLKIIFIILSASLVLTASNTKAEKKNEKFLPNAVYICGKWDVVDISFSVNKKIAQPFKSIFGVRATSPGGKIISIPGFYDGNDKYILRINPNEVGEWSFLTYSDLKGLSGLSFRITVTKTTGKNQHGPIVLSQKHPGQFEYADGKPYFMQAYELDWLFALDADNPAGIPKTKMLVDTISAYRFNQIIMNVFACDVSWKKDPSLKHEYDYGSPDLYPFGGTNSKPDYKKLNTTFFRRLDRVIEYLGSKNIVAHLMIYVWNKKVNWPPMYSQADNMYFDYVIKRYQGYPNVIWDVAKEALSYGRCDMNYVSDRIHRIRKIDAYKRILTVHDFKYCEKYPDMVDFISIQYWGSDLYEKMFSIKEFYKDKPVFNIEHGGYEKGVYETFSGDYTNPTACLKRNYLCAFAGVYSTYYWQNTSWYVIIPQPMNLPKKYRPHFDYYKYFIGLFSTYGYENLLPVKNASSSGYCLEDMTKRIFLYLIPEDNSGIGITLNEYDGMSASVAIFNPMDGTFAGLPSIKLSGWNHIDLPPESSFRILIVKVQK